MSSKNIDTILLHLGWMYFIFFFSLSSSNLTSLATIFSILSFSAFSFEGFDIRIKRTIILQPSISLYSFIISFWFIFSIELERTFILVTNSSGSLLSLSGRLMEDFSDVSNRISKTTLSASTFLKR